MNRPRSALHDASVLNSSASLRGVDVAVIGEGPVGVCSALELAQRGASVALLERGPQPAWACSAGNAGIVGPAHVVPLAGARPAVDIWPSHDLTPFRPERFSTFSARGRSVATNRRAA